jgi:hypothetical protein
VEAALAAAIPGVEVTIHVEPVDEEESWEEDYLRQIGETGIQGSGGHAAPAEGRPDDR